MNNDSERPLVGRYLFKHTIEGLIDLIGIHDDTPGKFVIEDPDGTEHVKSEKFDSWFPIIYHDCFHKIDTYLGHYFRHLYRTMQMIDEQKFFETPAKEFEMKQKYAAIVRAQLSDYEIKWAFFNGLFDYGQNFKPLIEKYSLVKILDGTKDPVIIKLKKFYQETAFKEPVA